MGTDLLVTATGVSKKYCRELARSLWYGLRDFAGEITAGDGAGRLTLRPGEFLALDDVGFELHRGECLGLVGANGAGKSTLLKLLNGLLRPDSGRIEIRGRVGGLIELGAGFNPLLSGRENIYINGAVLGMTRADMNVRFDDIVSFAELEPVIDAPVQTYSSGMRARLGYAVASRLEPDVLLIDEVLAVGDLPFRLKCLNSLEQQRRRAAVIFVTHQMPQVARVCTRAMHLVHGRVVAQGEPAAVIESYLAQASPRTMPFQSVDGIAVQRVLFAGEATAADNPYRLGHLQDLVLDVEINVPAAIPRVFLSMGVFDRELQPIGECLQRRAAPLHNTGAPLRARITLPRVNLSRGVYTVTLGVNCADSGQILARFPSLRAFLVTGEHPMWAPVHFDSIIEQLP